MDKNSLIQLTNNLYRLTLLFPKKEPLRYKMRELADDILIKPNGKSLEVLDNLFEIAKAQNWVSLTEILAVQQDYDILKRGLNSQVRERKIEVKKEFKEGPIVIEGLAQASLAKAGSERQERILAFLKENGRAQVWEIKQILPEVSKRTLRRDFDNLLGQGIIERIGERNNTFYQIKNIQS